MRMDCRRLEFNDSLRMEFGVKICQYRARIMVSSCQHKNSRNWYGIMGGDLDY